MSNGVWNVIKFNKRSLSLLAGTALMLVLPHAGALPILGMTFSVASDPGDQGVGTHFHSDTGFDFFGPGFAEVGSFEQEEVRGLSEFDLTGLGGSAATVLSFNTQGFGLFSGLNDFAFDGDIDIIAYAGNNLENTADYEIASAATIGSFNTTGLTVGTAFNFDVTTIYNNAITNGWTSLGVRLSTEDTSDDGGAWTFDNFQLVPGATPSVPEPGSFLLLLIGFAGLLYYRSRAGQGLARIAIPQ